MTETHRTYAAAEAARIAANAKAEASLTERVKILETEVAQLRYLFATQAEEIEAISYGISQRTGYGDAA